MSQKSFRSVPELAISWKIMRTKKIPADCLSIIYANINKKTMALINCPECKKEISNRAEACPSCGFPIRNKKIVVKQSQGIFLRTMNFGCFTVIIIFFLIAYSLLRTSSHPKINKITGDAKTAIINRFTK